jgi:hypothetical protein
MLTLIQTILADDGGIVNLIKSDKQLLIENVLRDYYKIESQCTVLCTILNVIYKNIFPQFRC